MIPVAGTGRVSLIYVLVNSVILESVTAYSACLVKNFYSRDLFVSLIKVCVWLDRKMQ